MVAGQSDGHPTSLVVGFSFQQLSEIVTAITALRTTIRISDFEVTY
jgi:hypothetical protein